MKQLELRIPRQVGGLLERFLGGELLAGQRGVAAVAPVARDVVIVVDAVDPLEVDDLRRPAGEVAVALHTSVVGVGIGERLRLGSRRSVVLRGA